MSRFARVLLPAIFIIALCGAVTASAFAAEDPFYKVNGSRLGAGATKEVTLAAEGSQKLAVAGAGTTITCTGIAAKKGSTINGSALGEPGTSADTIEYTGCSVVGNGEKCVITSVAGAKDGKIVTKALKDELVMATKEHVKGNKHLDLFIPASGSVFAEVKFEAETGGKCKNAATVVEGSQIVEILNAKKEVVAFEERETEEEFGFITAILGGEACKSKEGTFAECKKASLKAFGVAARLEGIAKMKLATAEKFGVFGGPGGPPGTPTPQEEWGPGSNPGAPGVLTEKCGKAVNCATGDETTQQTDTAIGGRGPGLNIVRSYDAQASAAAQAEGKGGGLWGWGWTGPYGVSLVFASESGQETATVQQQNGSAITFYKNAKGEYEQGTWVQARLVKEGANYLYTLPSETKLEFNGEGKLIKETEPSGNTVTLTYNGSKQLEKVTDSTGRTLTFKYNAEKLVDGIKDPLGHVVNYTYTANGGLATVSIEGKVRWKFGYTATSPYLLASVTDGREHATTLEYDGSHRVVKETIAGHERKWKYGTGETTITEPSGSESLDTFNAANEPTKIVQAKGTGDEEVTEYEYNETTLELTKAVDPMKHMTEYGYDGEGNRTSEKDPNGDERKWEYDEEHNVVKETTPEGESTTIKRNEAGEPTVVERPAGAETQKTEYKYDAEGDLTEVIDPLGHVTKYAYDAHGNKESEEDAEGSERKWKYNEDSQETEEVSPRGYATKTERNEYGLPIKVTDPLGHMTEYSYNANQDVAAETDGNKHVIKYDYNTEDLRTKVTEPNGTIAETGYDAEGNKTSYTDGNGHIWEYKRNLLEQVTEEKNPLGKIWKKLYDKAGNLTKREDPEKHTTEYAYDESNRPSKVKYSTGSPSEVTYEYNKDSKVTKMKDTTGTTENTWDKLDRLIEYKSGAGKTVKYEYGLADLPVKITYPNGEAVTREYDKDNRLAKVTDWKGNATSFKYNSDSEPASATFPSGTESKDEYAYNEADQLSEIKLLKGATSLATFAYERDGDGQVKKLTGKSGEATVTSESVLDQNNRLFEANKLAFDHNKANAPTKIEGEAGYSYNEADQLKEGPTAKYTFNEDGQRTKLEPKSGEPATTYGYDQAGNLTSIKRAKGTKEPEINDAITYDANNLAQANNKANITWDTAEALPIPLNNEVNNFIYGPGNLPIEQITGTTVLYLHHDQQGSTRILTDSAGAIAGTATYGPYGNLKEATGASTPLGYDGQTEDRETGLIYLRARMYDPSTAQFLSIDPAIESTGEPYSYAKDNPENRSDLSGECAQGGPPKKALCALAISGLFGAVDQAEQVIRERKWQSAKAALLVVGGALGGVAAACAKEGPGGFVKEKVAQIERNLSNLSFSIAHQEVLAGLAAAGIIAWTGVQLAAGVGVVLA